MNLYQKIIEVKKIAGSFSKDTKGFGYDYVSGNQILNKIKDKMNEVGLILQPSTKVGEHQLFCYTNNKGQEKVDIQVWGEMFYTWINVDNPEERETVEWAYYGQQDDISKSFGSALTYSERYFLLKYFGLPTDEDNPDSKDTTGKSRQNANARGQSKAQPKAKAEQPDAKEIQAEEELQNKLIDKVKIASIEAELKRTGVPAKQITDRYKVFELRQLTIVDYSKAMNILAKMADKPKTDLGL